jgi:anti-anti-sigma factor
MIDIKILDYQQGAVVLYECKSLDARVATRLHTFWKKQWLNKEHHYDYLNWMVVDMHHVLVMDASGLAMLVYLYQQLAAGAPLYLVGCNVAVTQLLQDTHLSEVFPQFNDLAAIPAIGTLLTHESTAHYRSYQLHSAWSL